MTGYFSAPGRTELCGNHTDHQHGRVLAAAVNREMKAKVETTDSKEICILSEGYPPFAIDIDDLSIRPQEIGSSAALVRGIAAAFQKKGARLRGLRAEISSQILPGSGLSSSAAFEVLIGTIFNHLFFEQKCSPLEIAQMGQWAENLYFGKPCGLMDQTACAMGGMAYIDFKDPSHPAAEQLNVDFERYGYTLCIVNSGADHADLTAEYASIPMEMGQVAAFFGKEVLREVDEREFYAKLAALRQTAGDRAVLRAFHFFAENRRVQSQVTALKNGDFSAFLAEVNNSGKSSWQLLQNVVPAGAVSRQELAVSLAMAQQLLQGKGAVRLHGGGFAGTMQAFVKTELLEGFCAGMEGLLGKGCCQLVSIRQKGGIQLAKTAN